MTDRRVVICDGKDVLEVHDLMALAEAPFDTLRGWVEYTRQERGWAAEPRVSSSITGQLKGTVARTVACQIIIRS